MSLERRFTGGWRVALALQAALVALTLVRLAVTRESAFGVDPCLSCQAVTLVQHDAGLWALAWGVLLVAALGATWLRVTGVIVFIALFLLMVADTLVMALYGMRLFLGDLVKFGAQPGAVLLVGHQSIGVTGLLAGVVAVIVVAWLAVRATRGPGATGRLAVLLAVCAGAYLLPDRVGHSLPWTYQNLVEANWPTGADRPYSDEMKARLSATDDVASAQPLCEAGEALQSDVIVVVVESLSWYHSGLLLADNLGATPRLDDLARDHTWWSAFHANGWTTDHALVALIAGEVPLPAVGRYHSLDAFGGYGGGPQTLPARLARDGYFSAFFTTGPLGFLDKGAWLAAQGFDLVEGGEHPAYRDVPKYAFGSAGDSVLYQRVIDWLDAERPPGQPVMLFLETVTTHPPFIDPDSGRKDEVATFRYADQALAAFVEALDQAGWLEKNLLIITSDQRALTPYTPAERAQFGNAASARLPLVVLGGAREPAGRQDKPAQMIDLPYSLDRLLTNEACRRPGQGDWFSGESPQCILQPEGNERAIINAWCGPETIRIRMDGDDTRVIEGNMPDQEQWIERINERRIRLGEREATIERVL